MLTYRRGKTAVFTITKNEKYFLPIWFKYYAQHIPTKDIYVLDHGSTDGSTIGKSFQKIKLRHGIAWDHEWMRKTVSEFQQKLLTMYDVVLFAEADEIVVPDPLVYGGGLKEYMLSMSNNFVGSNSFNVCHCIQQEAPLDLTKKILQQRRFFHKLYPKWGKTTLSKIPLDWSIGFHQCKSNKPLKKNYIFDEKLYLFHLRFVDHDIYWNRIKERTDGEKIKNDGLGSHNYKNAETQKEAKENFNFEPKDRAEIPSYFSHIF